MRSWNTLLNDKQSKWMSLYSMSKDQLKKVRTYLDENLKREFIRSSKSLTEYSILFVSKKNDTKQLCVNYRQLNKITKQDSYFLLLIKELQDRLDRVKWFTSLTWKKPITEYKWRKAKNENSILNKIQTLQIHCYAVWAQERPVTFQRLINDTLREYLNDFAITYLDDILIYSDDLEMHCSHVHKVLRKAQWKGFVCEKSKSRFETKKIEFLNYVIQFEQIKKNSRRQTQSETGLHQNESRKYKPFRVDELLLKVCI
jgi:hypothetical protein